ncbi:hydroxycinnamoyl-CoA shikimate/quinate hydroxycinnamoyl transferase, partial [Perilla frutescens var. frutescens]
CVSKARDLPEDQETNLYIPVDGRSRLRPPLPPGYFGNVVFRATATALCGELESNHLEFAVHKIHEAMAEVGNGYLRSAIDYLEVHGDELDPRVRGAACYKCPNLGVVSWARFRFYDTDFGWGCPIRLGFDRILPEGNTILLPAPADDDGALLFAIVLPQEQMQVFEKLFCDIV